MIKFVLLVFIAMAAGCATTSTHKTTTTETTVQAPADTAAPRTTAVEHSTTTTTNTETKPQHTGIIGGLFHIIGSIIAFPFLVVGNLLRAIF